MTANIELHFYSNCVSKPLCNAWLQMADVCRVTDKVDALVRRHIIS